MEKVLRPPCTRLDALQTTTKKFPMHLCSCPLSSLSRSLMRVYQTTPSLKKFMYMRRCEAIPTSYRCMAMQPRVCPCRSHATSPSTTATSLQSGVKAARQKPTSLSWCSNSANTAISSTLLSNAASLAPVPNSSSTCSFRCARVSRLYTRRQVLPI